VSAGDGLALARLRATIMVARFSKPKIADNQHSDHEFGIRVQRHGELRKIGTLEGFSLSGGNRVKRVLRARVRS
jgi:hypothetical protein